MLMVAILSVLRTVLLQRRMLQERIAAPWRQRMAEQFYWDITNARSMRWQADALYLEGYGGCDAESGLATHRPTRVAYLVRRAADRSWLLRQETTWDEPDSSGRSSLVAADVTGIEIQAADLTPADETDRFQPVPRRLRLVLHGPTGGAPLLDRTYFLAPAIDEGDTEEQP